MKTHLLDTLAEALGLHRDSGTKEERRHHRSARTNEAVIFFLEALRQRNGLEAVALSTRHGELVAGVGALDTEWMGMLGASRRLTHLTWEGRELHVQRLDVNGVRLFLTTAGVAIPAEPELSGIRRVLRAA